MIPDVLSVTLDLIDEFAKLRKLHYSSESREIGEAVKLLLERLSHAFNTLVESVMRIAFLSFENDGDVTNAKKFLFDSKYGFHRTEIMGVRATSSIIEAIRGDYLRKKQHTPKKQKELRLLENLIQLSKEISHSLDDIERFIAKSSGEIFELLEEKKLQDATKKTKEFRVYMDEPIKQIREQLDNITDIGFKFITITDDGFKVLFQDMKSNEKYSFDFEDSNYEIMKGEKDELTLREVG